MPQHPIENHIPSKTIAMQTYYLSNGDCCPLRKQFSAFDSILRHVLLLFPSTYFPDDLLQRDASFPLTHAARSRSGSDEFLKYLVEGQSCHPRENKHITLCCAGGLQK